MSEATGFKLNPAYIEIGKQLAITLAATYAAVNPLIGLGAAGLQVILSTQARLALQNDILLRAQTEGWTEHDARWAAPLAEQEERMQTENTRHVELMRQRAALPPDDL